MHGGIARPKRFLRRHYSSRRPSGLQGISTARKSIFSSRNTRTKADKHFGHKLFGKYVSSRKSIIKNVSMSNGVKIKKSGRASKGSNASKSSKASMSDASLLNSAVRYAPTAANEIAAIEAAKRISRVEEQASARASRASRGRNGHMRNNNGAAAASSARSEAIRSGKRMSLAAVRRALSNAAASHSSHAAASHSSHAAALGPRDPRKLLSSQDSQDSQ